MKPSPFAVLAGFLAVVALGLLLAGRPGEPPAPPVVPEPGQPLPRVTAAGEALVWAQPDVAFLTFRMRVQGATAEQAAALLNASVESFGAALVPNLVPAGALRVADRQVHQLDRDLGRGEPPYQAEAALRVETEPARVSQVVAAALRAGATDFDGAVYGLRNSEKVQQEAIAKAVLSARNRAAAAAGVAPARLAEQPDLEVEVAIGEVTAPEAVLIKARVRATFTY